MFVVFLGAPGAGKGTQAAVVKERCGLVHISTGDLLREAVRQGTTMGQQAKGYMERGELVPDDLVVALVVDRMSRPDAAMGVLLDGFPRNLRQAEVLDGALKNRGQIVDLVVYLKVSEPVLVSRLAGRWTCPSCGAVFHELSNPPRQAGVCDQCGAALTQRADDRPETVRNRIKVYFEYTEPLLAYYRQRDLLREIDGEQSILDLSRQMVAAICGDAGKDG